MMKTAVLTQEPGASPGVTADPFSPVSPAESSSTSTTPEAAPLLPLSPSAPVPRPPPSALHRTTPSTPAPICVPKPPSSSPSALSKLSSASTDGPPTPHKPPAPAVPRTAAPHAPKPYVPPLPTHRPSATPQPRPPPPLNAKVSSPPLPRPPLPSVSRTPSSGAPSAQPASPAPTPAPSSTTTSSASTSSSSSTTTTTAASSVGAFTPSAVSASASASAAALPSISILEKLIKTCPVWLQLGVTKERATNILHKEAPRIFLVRKDPSLKAMVLAVRLPDHEGAPQIQELVVKEEKTLIYLEGSVLVFDNIFKLIAFYCVSRDILPFTLRLPQVIIQATKYEDMEIISTLGLEFWGSSLNSRLEDGVKGSGRDQGSSCEIQLSAGGDRLWYINPVFVEDHYSSLPLSSSSSFSSSPPPLPQPVLRSQSLNTTTTSTSTSSPSPVSAPGPGPKYKRPPPLPPRPLGAGEGPSPRPVSAGASLSTSEAAPSHAQGLPGPKPLSPSALAAAAHTQAKAKEEGSGERESSTQAARGGVDREEPSVKQQHQQTATTTQTAAQTPPDGISPQQPQAPAPAVPPQRKDSSKGKRPPPLGRPPSLRVPPVPRRRPSEKQASEDTSGGQAGPAGEAPSPAAAAAAAANSTGTTSREEEGATGGVVVPVGTLICLDGTDMEDQVPQPAAAEVIPRVENAALQGTQPVENSETPAPLQDTVAALSPVKKRGPPVPPPRSKRLSAAKPSQGQSISLDTPLGQEPTSPEFSSLPLQGSSTPQPTRRSLSVDPKLGDISIYSPDAAAGSFPQHPDNDSYSTSSAEDETDPTQSPSGGTGGSPTSGGGAGGGGAGGGGGGGGGGGCHPSVKRTPTIILDRAKQRLSMVNFSSVFTGILNAEQKLQKRVVELSRDANSYFGCLVRDHRTFTLDTLKKHASSTEMLQEIRQMMTQLKSYLIQSAEIQSLQEPNIFSDEKLEVIIEAALCKSVLKPLRESIYNSLRDIHTRDGTLKRLRENQQVVLATTTTDLGVTTCVPETPVMEKITQKLGRLHQEYSPQKKIDTLLKTCKMIYDSMSVGSQGKAHGADDFLPVLMYVLARSNMTALLLDVEYMMELMDPALQLGEGSYYLTTTYGALEHIKNYDREPVTRQLSLEIQDSIHRWERRRTLNKARVSRSSVQDFINVSLLEAGANTKTLGVRSTTTAQDLCAQCAEKFEVLDPDSYCLSVLVDGVYKSLGPDEKPLEVKSALHHSEPRKEYYFVYRLGRWPEGYGEEEAQVESQGEAQGEPQGEPEAEAEADAQVEAQAEELPVLNPPEEDSLI